MAPLFTFSGGNMANNNILIEKAGILVEALPYIQRLSGKTIVVKYGGNAMVDEGLTHKILQDITLLKYIGLNPIVVHGGGPEISQMLKALNIQSSFHNGLRVTDEAAMDVVQMVLTGKLNKNIASRLNQLGAHAIGLCGLDAQLIKVSKKLASDGVDLGYVGEIESINKSLLSYLAKDEYIPVIAPVGVGEDGHSYNINADTVAGEIAVALQAEKLIFLTDIDGVRLDENDPQTLISAATAAEIRGMIEDKVITGGMIPKVMGCVYAAEHGVNRVHIIDGTIEHPLLLEIFTDKGIGTMITKGENE
jgi:acetylglutamate kinase